MSTLSIASSNPYLHAPTTEYSLAYLALSKLQTKPYEASASLEGIIIPPDLVPLVRGKPQPPLENNVLLAHDNFPLATAIVHEIGKRNTKGLLEIHQCHLGK